MIIKSASEVRPKLSVSKSISNGRFTQNFGHALPSRPALKMLKDSNFHAHDVPWIFHYKGELVNGDEMAEAFRHANQDETMLDVTDCIIEFYNARRLHSKLGY